MSSINSNEFGKTDTTEVKGGASKNSTMGAQCAPVPIFVQYPHNDLHFQEITLKLSVKKIIDMSQF